MVGSSRSPVRAEEGPSSREHRRGRLLRRSPGKEQSAGPWPGASWGRCRDGVGGEGARRGGCGSCALGLLPCGGAGECGGTRGGREGAWSGRAASEEAEEDARPSARPCGPRRPPGRLFPQGPLLRPGSARAPAASAPRGGACPWPGRPRTAAAPSPRGGDAPGPRHARAIVSQRPLAGTPPFSQSGRAGWRAGDALSSFGLSRLASWPQFS